MQQFLSGLAWNNLSIRAKLALTTVLLLGLIGAGTTFSSLALGSIGAQTRVGVANTIEMRSLAQGIQLSVESLQRIHTRLVEDYSRPGFDPTTTSLRDDFMELAAQVREQDVPRLQSLLLAAAPEGRHQAIEVEFRALDTAIANSTQNFDQVFSVIAQLTDPSTGALRALDEHGDAMESPLSQTPIPTLQGQMILIRSLEGSLVRTGSNEDLLDLRQAVQSFRVDYQNLVPEARQSPELLSELEIYLEQVDAVGRLLLQLDLASRTAQVSLNFARDASSRAANIAMDEADAQALAVQRLTAIAARPILLSALVQALVLVILMIFFARGVVTGILNLLSTTRRFEQGNLRARAPVSGHDELSQLARSFNTMAAQLSELIGSLEVRVAERTRDLSIAAEIGSAVLAQRDLRELLQEVVELIRQRFDFYHVQVFLVDDETQHAELVASTGAAGRALLARRHALPVGSQSVIGQVTALGEPVIASDTDTSPIHRRNELLPDTRSEMALPMRIGGRAIGALDVQSVAPNAFDQDTIAVFQIMADQLAIAAENARLHSQIQQAIRDFESLERSMVAESWRSYQRSREPGKPLAYELQGEVILPHNDRPPAPLQEAMEHGQPVTQDNGGDIRLALPIKVRGEVIGAFGFGGEQLRNLTGEDIALVQAVVDRVGLALENMRLVEQTARRAEYEQIVNAITAKIVGSTDVNFILQTTVRELGRALRAPQTSVQLRREGTDTEDEQ